MKVMTKTAMTTVPSSDWIELSQSDGALIASYQGVPVPVWVRSGEDLSLAVAIRR